MSGVPRRPNTRSLRTLVGDNDITGTQNDNSTSDQSSDLSSEPDWLDSYEQLEYGQQSFGITMSTPSPTAATYATGITVNKLPEKIPDHLRCNGSNFESFKGEFVNNLWRADLLDVIFTPTKDGLEYVDPSKDSKTRDINYGTSDRGWITKLIDVQSLLKRSVDKKVLAQIQGENNPLLAFKKIETYCVGSGRIQSQISQRSLFALRPNQFSSPDQFVTEFENIRLRLVGLGRSMDEQSLVDLFITCCQDDFPTWARIATTQVRFSPPGNALRDIQTSFLDEIKLNPKKETALYSSHSSGHYNKKANGNNNKGNKKNNKHTKWPKGQCKHEGHPAEKCWSDHPDQAPEWWKKVAKSPQAETASASQTQNTTLYAQGNPSCFSADNGESKAIVADSGSSCHISAELRIFTKLEYRKGLSPIRTGGGFVYPTAVGEVELKSSLPHGTSTKVTLAEVFYVEGFPANIFSLQVLYRKGGQMQGRKILNASGQMIGCVDERFHLQAQPLQQSCLFSTQEGQQIDYSLWHNRLGHLSKDMINKVARAADGLFSNGVQSTPDQACEPCGLSKNYRYTPKGPRPTPEQAGEEWHVDTAQVKDHTESGNDFWNIFPTDGKTKFRASRSFKTKGEATTELVNFFRMAKRQWKIKVKTIQLDGGNELYGKEDGEFAQFCKSEGIRLIISAPYMPEQNGVAERTNRVVLEMARTWLIAAAEDSHNGPVPSALWHYFVEAAADYSNYLPFEEDPSITRYEAFMRENVPGRIHRVDLSNLKTPGSRVAVHIPLQRRDLASKLDYRAEKGILLNWLGKTVYRTYLPERPGPSIQQKVVRTSNLIIYEKVGTATTETKISDPDISEEADSITVTPLIRASLPPNARHKNNLAELLDHCFIARDLPETVPISLSEALAGPERQQWLDATHAEFHQMIRLGVFKAIDRSKVAGRRTLTPKLVFKKKLDQDGNVEKYKCRLVIRGFEQREGVDFDQTFAAVARAPTWRFLLSLAAYLDWEIHQVDVIAAFLNGDLEEEVLMEIPDGLQDYLRKFSDENSVGLDPRKDQVLLLLKALYGLKQAPRQWQKSLKSTLNKLGFTQLQSDTAVFIHYTKQVIVIAYVDDMLVMGPRLKEVQKFKKDLSESYEITDLGELKYFLGIRILRNRDQRTLTLLQDAYIKRVLETKGYHNCKPASTPLPAGSLIKAMPYDQTANETDKRNYGSTVGSEMYPMTCTRPDTCFALSVVSRFSHNPSPDHFGLANGILRYFRGTELLGLQLGGKSDTPSPHWLDTEFNVDGPAEKKLEISIYCDSDWKGDKATMKSTYSVVVQMNNSTVHWKAKRGPRPMASTTEAEFYAIWKAVQQALWFRNICKELRLPLDLTIYNDNQGAVKLSHNPEFHERTAHLPLDEHLVRHYVENKLAKLRWVSTADQIADGLTKPLGPSQHKDMLQRLGMVDVSKDVVRFTHPV